MATDMTTVQKKMMRVTATVQSADGAVTATVGPRGHLIDLKLDPKIYRRPNSGLLAQTIVQTVREAVEQAAKETQDMLEGVVPDEYHPDKMMQGFGLPKGALRKHDAVLLKEQEEEDDD
ncbi:MAG: YbaB/EbfC family nucleoid-associated protein [Micromonosporaceae bacterium]